MNTQTIWTRLGGTKFIAFMVLAVWAMTLMSNGVKPDKDILEFVKYIFWGFMLGNVGAIGVQTFAGSKTAATAGAISGTMPTSTNSTVDGKTS